ncbi:MULTISPECIES: TetR/AcrR family transcriptional regulator [unclassified Actinoplanes]|uniref:TetR/AcrR family transcriptional regulator n=1 Tax=unclassified Actinoplanes TaxID=2626549 RepID=UPI00043A30FC|nr:MULTISPECIES: TetR/AcrR family transcriptional regulator [unclassified Actinoplanes]
MSSPHPAAPVGRPRSSGARRLGGSAREEIVDAAAALFAERGYAATSTRMIAERVGVRQASLYYHFRTKEQILAEMLEATVRPSVDYAAALSAQGLGPADTLRALVRYDVGVLLGARWNIGILYALPEIATEPFAHFRAGREQLRVTYRELAGGVIPGDLILGLVESVIGMRRDLAVLPPHDQLQDAIAAAALRLIEND